MIPFTFNRNYDDNEQVRPWYPLYAARRAELDAASKYPYNDSFKGHVGEAVSDKDEDTLIYLLQTMHSLDEMRVKVAAFGGTPALEALERGETRRGTVAHYGWYGNGTGWTQWEGVRLRRDEKDRLVLLKPRERNGSWLLGGSVLFK